MAKVQPIPTDSRFQDLTSQRFGHWFVVGYAGRTTKNTLWHVICRCGTTRITRGSRLTSGCSTSCKCGDGLTLSERLLNRRVINSETGCWEWHGHSLPSGYGLYTHKKKTFIVHRLSYETFVGPIPDGMFVCHHCDNPRCFRPECLFLGTREDNTNDMLSKERQARGERVGVSKLVTKDIATIRTMATSGYTQQEIADQFDVSQMTICRIIAGKIWRHIP